MGLLLASLEEERRQERGRLLSKLGEVLIEVLCSQNPYLGCCRMWFKVWVLQICCGLWCWRRRWKKLLYIRAGSKPGFSDSRRFSPALSLGFRPPAIQTARNQRPSL